MADRASPESSGRQRGGEAPLRSSQEIKHQRGPWPGTDVSAMQLKARAPAPAQLRGEGGPQLPAALARTAQLHCLRAGLSTRSQTPRRSREAAEPVHALRALRKRRNKDC